LKKSLALFTVLAVSLSAAIARADTLKGSAVRAQLIFLNDPNQSNPTNLLTGGTGFHDTLDKVGSGKEYSYDDGIATYSANFNADQLILRVKCDASVSLKKCNNEPGFAWAFKDDVFADSIFSVDPASTFIPTIAGSPAPNIILIADLLSSDPCGCSALTMKNSKFIIDISPAPVPEPGSIALLGAGLLGFTGAARRRFTK